MARGRPPMKTKLVDKLEGSEAAKKRLKVILRTVSGDLTVEQACAELGVGKTAFHEMRDLVLQASLSDLEPKPRGRPAREVSPEQAELDRVNEENQHLRDELEIAHVREELALAMPEVFDPGKKTPQPESKRQARNRRKRKQKKR